MAKGKEAIEELRAMKAKIDEAISALEQVYATNEVENRLPVSHVGDYSRMSLRAGALDAVLNSKEPQTTKDIVNALLAGGLRSKSKALGRTVYTTLYGLAKAPDSKIEMAGDGKWVRK